MLGNKENVTYQGKLNYNQNVHSNHHFLMVENYIISFDC